MSEENFLKDIAKSIKVPADITKAALEPPASQIGVGLGDLFYLVFSPLAKARIKKQQEIHLFRQEIENELSKIPPNNISEPPLNVIGPALEASKYYIENAEIRSMFAKLISSSINTDMQEKTHSSFIEIIKQFSPFDARNFEYLHNNTHTNIAVGKIKTKNLDGSGENTFIENFFPFPDLNMDNRDLFSASVDNFIRLGLIQIDHSLHYILEERYDPLYNHKLYLEYKDLVDTHNNIEAANKKELYLKKSIWDFTSFGKLFAQCCL